MSSCEGRRAQTIVKTPSTPAGRVLYAETIENGDEVEIRLPRSAVLDLILRTEAEAREQGVRSCDHKLINARAAYQNERWLRKMGVPYEEPAPKAGVLSGTTNPKQK